MAARGVKGQGDPVGLAVGDSGRLERNGSELQKKDSELQEVSSESRRKDVEL